MKKKRTCDRNGLLVENAIEQVLDIMSSVRASHRPRWFAAPTLGTLAAAAPGTQHSQTPAAESRRRFSVKTKATRTPKFPENE